MSAFGHKQQLTEYSSGEATRVRELVQCNADLKYNLENETSTQFHSEIKNL